MQNPDLAQLLDDAGRAARFYSLSVVQSGQEWQANLQESQGAGWRVCHGLTPAEAIAALFSPVPQPLPELPPCPVPPCPV